MRKTLFATILMFMPFTSPVLYAKDIGKPDGIQINQVYEETKDMLTCNTREETESIVTMVVAYENLARTHECGPLKGAIAYFVKDAKDILSKITMLNGRVVWIGKIITLRSPDFSLSGTEYTFYVAFMADVHPKPVTRMD